MWSSVEINLGTNNRDKAPPAITGEICNPFKQLIQASWIILFASFDPGSSHREAHAKLKDEKTSLDHLMITWELLHVCSCVSQRTSYLIEQFIQQVAQLNLWFYFFLKLPRYIRKNKFIIWQTQSLCSHWFFLGQDFAARTVSMETVQSVYFCFGAKPANSTFASKTAKNKVWKLSFFTLKLTAEAKKIEFFPKFQRWMKKRNIF